MSYVSGKFNQAGLCNPQCLPLSCCVLTHLFAL